MKRITLAILMCASIAQALTVGDIVNPQYPCPTDFPQARLMPLRKTFAVGISHILNCKAAGADFMAAGPSFALAEQPQGGLKVVAAFNSKSMEKVFVEGQVERVTADVTMNRGEFGFILVASDQNYQRDGASYRKHTLHMLRSGLERGVDPFVPNVVIRHEVTPIEVELEDNPRFPSDYQDETGKWYMPVQIADVREMPNLMAHVIVGVNDVSGSRAPYARRRWMAMFRLSAYDYTGLQLVWSTQDQQVLNNANHKALLGARILKDSTQALLFYEYPKVLRIGPNQTGTLEVVPVASRERVPAAPTPGPIIPPTPGPITDYPLVYGFPRLDQLTLVGRSTYEPYRNPFLLPDTENRKIQFWAPTGRTQYSLAPLIVDFE
jgi:hypothetical protein